jgi:hypothetical protein
VPHGQGVALGSKGCWQPILPPHSAMDCIKQNIIPTSPANITIRHFRRRQTGEAFRQLLTMEPGIILGLSIRLSADGTVDLLALATSREIFKLELDSSSKNSSLDLSSALDHATLVAFEMAPVAVHIHRSSQQHVRGVDLSTLLSPSSRQPWKPSTFVERKLCSFAQALDIDRLWESNQEDGFREVCLRAWLSARSGTRLYRRYLASLRQFYSVAECCAYEVKGALKIDSRLVEKDVSCVCCCLLNCLTTV